MVGEDGEDVEKGEDGQDGQDDQDDDKDDQDDRDGQNDYDDHCCYRLYTTLPEKVQAFVSIGQCLWQRRPGMPPP